MDNSLVTATSFLTHTAQNQDMLIMNELMSDIKSLSLEERVQEKNMKPKRRSSHLNVNLMRLFCSL